MTTQTIDYRISFTTWRTRIKQTKWYRYIRNYPFSLTNIIILGIVLRLITALIFTFYYDASNILALTKSFIETGSVLAGYNQVKGIQMYGIIFYEVIGYWMKFLQHFHLVNLRMMFDVKAYAYPDPSYMSKFPIFGPMVHEWFLIKMPQFIYSFILLFYLLKTVKILNLKHEKAIALFWAINPLFVYTEFVLMQSDSAMIACLMGGVYHAIRALKQTSKKQALTHKVLSLFWLAIGASIKQVPMLIFPFVLILFSNSLFAGCFYCIVFGVFYLLGTQPWLQDAQLIHNQFLLNNESMALFTFQFNGLNIFLFGYLWILYYFFTLRNKVTKSPIFLLHFVIIVLTIITIVDQSDLFFIQFNTWLLPFIALLALYKRDYAIFLIVPFLGYLRRSLSDGTTTMAHATGVSFGEPIAKSIAYNVLLNRFISSGLVDKMLSTIFTMCYLILLFYIFQELMRNKAIEVIHNLTTALKLNIIKITVFLSLLFLVLSLADMIISSYTSQLTSFAFDTIQEFRLDKHPVAVTISNPGGKNITGIALRMYALQLIKPDSILFTATDSKTHKLLMTTKINEYSLPTVGAYYDILFSKPVSAKEFTIHIQTAHKDNAIIIYSAPSFDGLNRFDYPLTDHFSQSDVIHISYPGTVFAVNIRGEWNLFDMSYNLLGNMGMRRKFLYGYWIGLCLLIISIFIPYTKIFQMMPNGKISSFQNLKKEFLLKLK